jgi:hypothetical protein
MICKTRCFDSGACTTYYEGQDYKFDAAKKAYMQKIGLLKHFEAEPAGAVAPEDQAIAAPKCFSSPIFCMKAFFAASNL